MNKSKSIGIFDSGIGGITVFKEIVKLLPNESYIYYSDSKNNPYGEKTDEEIFNISDRVVNYFIEKNCKAIVIACNTASCISAEKLRKKYNQIPIIAIEPAYKMVHDYSCDKSTLVMATKRTIESEKFNRLYEKYNNYKTYLLACNGLADIIEDENQEKINKYLEDNLKKYCGKVENVVLGCTHYPLIQKDIERVLGNVTFFNGAPNVAMQLKKVLNENNLINQSNEELKLKFIDSSNSESKKQRFFKLLNSSHIFI